MAKKSGTRIQFKRWREVSLVKAVISIIGFLAEFFSLGMLDLKRQDSSGVCDGRHSVPWAQ